MHTSTHTHAHPTGALSNIRHPDELGAGCRGFSESKHPRARGTRASGARPVKTIGGCTVQRAASDSTWGTSHHLLIIHSHHYGTTSTLILQLLAPFSSPHVTEPSRMHLFCGDSAPTSHACTLSLHPHSSMLGARTHVPRQASAAHACTLRTLSADAYVRAAAGTTARTCCTRTWSLALTATRASPSWAPTARVRGGRWPGRWWQCDDGRSSCVSHVTGTASRP